MMTKKRLYIALFVSAIVHLAGFTLWWHSRGELVISTTPLGSPLNVSITQAPASAESKKQSTTGPGKRDLKPSLVTSSKQITAKPENKTFQTPVNDLTDEVQDQDKQQAHDQEKQLAMVNNNMISYLHTEFKLRFKYPMLARKHGWQGEVLLGLDINRNGKIAHVAIQRSSGYKVLDHNAVKTFELIGAVSPKVKTDLMSDHHLSIPVIYKLTGG